MRLFLCPLTLVTAWGIASLAASAQIICTNPNGCASTTASVPAKTAGNTVCFLGDSILGGPGTAGQPSLTADTQIVPTWPTLWTVLSNGQVQFIHNGGVAGDTTAVTLLRTVQDATSRACSKVLVDGGTDDIIGGLSLPAAEANLLSTYSAILGNGQTPILMTIPPYTGLYYTQIATLNAWIRKQSQKLNVPLFDLYAAMVSPTSNGDYASGYSADGIHPGPTGMRIAATAAVTALANIFPAHAPLIPFTNTDPTNLLSNGLMLTSASGIPTGWSAINASGHVTYTTAADSTMLGNALTITKSTTSAGDNDAIASPSIASGYSAGDTIAFTGRVLVTGLEAGVGSQVPVLDLICYNASYATLATFQPMAFWSSNIPNGGQYYLEATVPATTAYIQVQINIGNGIGVLKYGQMGLYDLTALGAK